MVNKSLLHFVSFLAVFTVLFTSGISEAKEEKVILFYGSQRKALPVTVIYPQQYNKNHSYPVILTLPPGAGNAQMVTVNLRLWRIEAQRRGFVVISPQIQGQNLESDGQDVLQTIFEWMDQKIQYDADRVTLTGQSNGGVGAFYLALYAPDRFRSVIVLPGGYPGPPEDLDRLKGKKIWMMVGSNDAIWKRSSQAVASSLKKAGAYVRLDVLPGQNHILNVNANSIFDWIQSSK